jgi:hypothetical protein
VHQQLLDLAAVRLIRRRVETELHGTHDAAIEARGEQHGFPARNGRDRLLEKLRRIVAAIGQHEIDRSAAGHAILQHAGQLGDGSHCCGGIENDNLGLFAHAARSTSEATVESALSL